MSDFQKDLQRMYDLGYKHGYEIATKEAELAQLRRAIEPKTKVKKALGK